MNILQINSSVRSAGSQSSQLATQLSTRLLAQLPQSHLTVRDLAIDQQPTLNEAALHALYTPAEQRTPEQAARVALDDALIAELQAADVIVIGAPMYNFGISAQLKNWFDAVARAGVTFRYTSTGAEGLVTGKKVYIVLTRGGNFKDTPFDNQAPHIKTFLAFLGMTDVQFVYAEGFARGPDAEQRAISTAQAQMEELVAA